MIGARLLRPEVLARIDNLELLARTVVDGFLSGLHRSPYLGFSVDFAEHRPYMPGDDIRRVDWRVFGRTDRYYVKQFEADTNANMLVLLDASASMSYGSGTVTKLDYARYLAASLAYFSRRQRDRVGLVTFDAGILDFVPASAKHLDIVLHTLDRLRPGGAGALPKALARTAEAIRRRSILVVISDFYDDPAVVQSALGRLRLGGHDLIAFHLLDPVEREFPFDEAAAFEDLETGERIPVVPGALRDEYRTLLEDHLATLTRLCAEAGVDYALLDTGEPLDRALFDYLSRRQRLARVR